MDEILHISIEGGQARALVADCTQLVAEAARVHQASPTAAAALGRALTATAMLSAMLKNDRDTLSVSINGAGPIGPVTCVGRASGNVKGCVGDAQVDLPEKAPGKLDVGGAVGTDGFITVVKDLGLKEPYVGRTRLISGEIAEDIAFYLTVSEQTPSLLALGVMVQDGQVLSAGGILVQPLPGCTERVLQMLEGLAPFLAQISALVRDAGDATHLAQLALVGFVTEVLDSKAVRYCCDCSREKIEGVLLSVGEEELLDMIEKQGGTSVHCHFCQTGYDFDAAQLQALIAEGKADEPN